MHNQQDSSHRAIKFNNYILSSYMFFGNPELLQRNLHTDLNTLIKDVKIRQEQYLTLLQYNKNLIANLSQIQYTSFITDEINKHKAYLNHFLVSNPQIINQQSQIMQKYSCVSSGESSIIKLMGRVIARVLQTCQSTFEKAKFLDPTLNEKYNQFRNILLDTLNEKIKINVSVLLSSIIEYIQSKNNIEIQRLQQIIQILVIGNFQKLNEVYIPIKLQQKKWVQIQRKDDKNDQQKLQIEKQRQQKLEKLRLEQEARELVQKTKKKKTKNAKDVVNIYSTMDLAKQQFLDDLTYSNNPQEKRRKLYQQLFSRNKLNNQQIIQFQAKKYEFEQKIKIFKQRMEAESKKIQQALVVVIHKTLHEHKEEKQIPKQVIKQMSRKQTKSETGNDDEYTQSMMPQKLQKLLRRRQLRPPIKAQTPCYVKQIAFSSIHTGQEGFQHIKFDTKNQQIFSRSNRARLPHIQGRSSLDNRYEGKNPRGGSEKKDEKRINIMKNIQIGVNALSVPLAKNLTKQDPANKKSPRDRPFMEPLFENIGNNTSNGLQYTFYVRKKTTKFYQTRTNFLL